jgi:2-haloacid dehalogenase
MNVTLAFDVYGTLIDTHGIVPKLREIIGEKAEAFSHTWRDKQLEYSFRRGLMQNYQNFATCTSNALDYASIYYNIPLTKEKKHELLDTYRVLPVFKDVDEGLTRLKKANYCMYVLSNGRANTIETLLETANIRDYFLDVVSVDDIKTFKPDPAVYRYFLKKTRATKTNAWLISSNSFDLPPKTWTPS